MRKKIALLYTGQGENIERLLSWLRQFGNVTLVMCDEQDLYYDCLVIGDNSPIPMPTPGQYAGSNINTQIEFFQSNLLERFITNEKIPIFGVGTGCILLWKFLKGAVDVNPRFFLSSENPRTGCITSFPAAVHGDNPLYSKDWKFNYYDIIYSNPQVINSSRRKIPEQVRVLAYRTPVSKNAYKQADLKTIKVDSDMMLEPITWYHTRLKLAGTVASPQYTPNMKGSRSYKAGFHVGDPVSNHVFKFFLDELEQSVSEPA